MKNIKKITLFVLLFLIAILAIFLYIGIIIYGIFLIAYLFGKNLYTVYILDVIWLFITFGGFIYWQALNEEKMRIKRYNAMYNHIYNKVKEDISKEK